MGHHPSFIEEAMYALYSKAFATKKAVDLNKKDFYAKNNYKVTAKGKSSTGIEFEANASDDNKADLTITVPVDDQFTVKLKTEASQDTEVTAELQATDAAKVSITAANPDLETAAMKVTGGIEYLDPAFSVDTSFCLYDGAGAVQAKADKKGFYFTGTSGLSAAIAFDAPMLDGVVLGLQPSFGATTEGKTVFNMPVSFGYAAKDFGLAFTGGVALKQADGKSSPVPTSAGLKGWFKVNDPPTLGFEVDNVFEKVNDKATFEALKSLGEKDSPFTMKLGGEYKLTPSTTGKLRLTYTEKDKLKYDAALKMALEGKSSLSAGISLTKDKPSIGLALNLEA